MQQSQSLNSNVSTTPVAKLWGPNFILICTANFAFWMCIFFHAPLLPLYMQQIGYTEAAIGFVYGIGALTALAGRVFLGWAIDRWGTRLFLLIGALIWIVTSPPMALTMSLMLLIAYRLIQGFGLAIFTTASLSYVAAIAPKERRGAAMSWWGMANNVATAIAPAIAAWMVQDWGFTTSFITAGIMALIAFVLAALIPSTMSQIASQPQTPQPIRLFTPSALFPGIIGGALGFANSAFVIFAPLWAQKLNTANVGIYLTTYAVAMILARMLAGTLSDRKGRAWTIVPGFILMTLSMILIGFIFDPTWALVVPFLLGLGVGSAMPSLLAWTMDRAGASERAVAGSTFYSIYEIGLFLGASILGGLLTGGAFTSFLFVALILAVACAGYIISLRSTIQSPGISVSK